MQGDIKTSIRGKGIRSSIAYEVEPVKVAGGEEAASAKAVNL